MDRDRMRIGLRGGLIAAAMLSLLAAMWAGLLRLGWAFPPLVAGLSAVHGPLMVSGFLGTLISLERAVALKLRWTYLAPAASGLGGILLMLGVPGWPGPLLITLGSAVLVAIFAVIVHRHPAPYTAVMALGAVCWLVGNGLWLAGWPIVSLVLWWALFLALTIAGERLELSRILRPSRAANGAFILAVAAALLGALIATLGSEAGNRLVGVGFVGMAAWLLRYDIARRTVRRSGLTRFIAVSLLAGYVWLGVSGLILILVGDLFRGAAYDATLHTFFLGYVISMIFGHAPIIFPAVLNRALGYRPAFYAHFTLLHLSLLFRVAGDAFALAPVQQWGGILNVIALLLFIANTVRSLR